jgi:hypothetical protein
VHGDRREDFGFLHRALDWLKMQRNRSTISLAIPSYRELVHRLPQELAGAGSTRITADRLVRHLERSGLILMKEAASAPTTSAIMPRPD